MSNIEFGISLRRRARLLPWPSGQRLDFPGRRCWRYRAHQADVNHCLGAALSGGAAGQAGGVPGSGLRWPLQFGGRPAPVKPGLFIFFAVHEDRDTGIKMAVDRLSLQCSQDFSALVGKYALAGNPDDIVARLREYIDAGARTIMLNSACPSDYVAENERLLAEAVMPALRS